MARSAKLFNFAGITPLQDDSLLNANSAMVAEDVDLRRGDILPIKGDKYLQFDLNTIKAMVDVGSDLLKTKSYYTDIAFGTPAGGNDFGRVFFIHDGRVRYTVVQNFVNGNEDYLGVPRPDATPVVSSTEDDCGDEEGCGIISSFCCTYVNQYGQESAPSRYTGTSSYGMGSISLSFNDPPVIDYHIVSRRIYRTIPSQTTGTENQLASGGDWFLAAEVNYAATQTVKLEPLASNLETMVSTTWELPPGGIEHLAVLPITDVLVLANDNVIYFSEPGNHHAFSRDRDIVIADAIKAIVHFAGTIVVLTDGHPYVITPSTNGSGAPIYDVIREDESYPCMSKQSVSVGSTGVVWASSDGVFTLNKTRYGINIKSLTSELFHFDDWRECKPETIRGALHNGSYYFTSDGQMTNSITGHKSHTWVLTYDKTIYDQPKNIFLSSLSVRPTIWYKSRRDRLYIAVDRFVYEWDPEGGTPLPYTYTSRVLVEPGLTNYSAAKIVNDQDGDLVFELWRETSAKPVLLYSRKVAHSQPFRLPNANISVDHFIKVIGTARIRRIHLADSLYALTNTEDTSMTHGNARLTQR